MVKWQKNYWISELKQLIQETLKTGDMTIEELIIYLRKTGKINIHHAAIASIIRVTEGIFVKNQIYSKKSKKMVNIYSVKLELR